jgi:hypothetical protein
MVPSRLALAALLVAAALLRFTALGRGLRHTPHIHEQYFVARPAHGLRLRQAGRRVRPWSVAELRPLEEGSGPGPDGRAW